MNEEERLWRIRELISAYNDEELTPENALMFIAYALDFWR